MFGIVFQGYNAEMRKKWLISLIFWVVAILLLSACISEAPQVTATPGVFLEGTLRPYPTNTATATPLPTDYVSPTPSPTVTPTATQVFYDVQAGDDMFGIGYRFGVHPNAIMTANPDVNPRAMGLGTTLLIPITPAPETTPTIEVAFTPTPIPPYQALGEPDCHEDAVGGLWCFVLVENDEDGALENVTALMHLEGGDETREEIAVMPLNLLPEGQSLPLVVYFDPPLPETFTISATIDFILPVMPGDQRYLPVSITEEIVTLSRNGKTARVTGELTLPDGQPISRYLWVNATALDEQGHVVAVRRWESFRQISGGETIQFSIMLYSLGDAIEQVDMLAEAGRVIMPTEDPANVD